MGAGNPPPRFTGREAQIQQFQTLLGRLARGRSDQSMIVWGLRGVGKTVLLLEFEGVAGKLGWVPTDPIEIKSDTDFRAAIAEHVYEALIRLDRRRAVGDKLRRLGRVLQGFRVAASTEGNLEFSFDVDEVGASTGDLERDLTRLFVEVGEVAQEHEAGIVFLIDEMQFLRKDEMEALAAAMHRMSQKQLPVALAGTGLPQLPGLMVEAKSYAERLFSYPRLDRLDDDAARDALVLPARDEGVEYEKKALTRVLELSDGYPTFLQAYGKEAWNTAPTTPITLADVDAAAPLVLTKLDEQFFHTRFEKATPTERRYMSAMANLGDGPQGSSAVTKLMGYKSSSGGSLVRDALIKKGLIYSPDYGQVDFTVPHFAPFMRRRYPFDG
jgi:AAA ATPase domain